MESLHGEGLSSLPVSIALNPFTMCARSSLAVRGAGGIPCCRPVRPHGSGVFHSLLTGRLLQPFLEPFVGLRPPESSWQEEDLLFAVTALYSFNNSGVVGIRIGRAGFRQFTS